MQPAVKKKGKRGPDIPFMQYGRPPGSSWGLAKDLPKFQKKRNGGKKYGVPGFPWPLAYSLVTNTVLFIIKFSKITNTVGPMVHKKCEG